MRGASFWSGFTPYSFAHRCQEVATSSMLAAGASPLCYQIDCSACCPGMSIECAARAALPIFPPDQQLPRAICSYMCCGPVTLQCCPVCDEFVRCNTIDNGSVAFQ